MIKDLIKEVTLQAEEVKENLAKQDELRVRIQEVCIENWKKMILPVLREYDQLFKYLTSCLRESVSFWVRIYVTHDAQRYYGIKLDSSCYKSGLSVQLLRSTPFKNPVLEDPDIEEEYKYKWDNYNNTSPETYIEHAECDLLNIDTANNYHVLLINEDACNKLLAAITDAVAHRLECLKDQLEGENSKLVGTINMLMAELASAHVPVSKEDGTVEVMLGGKKFVGTLKEEE